MPGLQKVALMCSWVDPHMGVLDDRPTVRTDCLEMDVWPLKRIRQVRSRHSELGGSVCRTVNSGADLFIPWSKPILSSIQCFFSRSRPATYVPQSRCGSRNGHNSSNARSMKSTSNWLKRG